ncbi:MAG TPA: methylenetetrahydrofolate reductase [Marmoricola sp.]|nr:methylenetetrahydrofolate reductase [Marmoricola sp.]
MDLIRDLEQGEFLLFALTPPRASTDPDRVREIAQATMDRLRPLKLDGLILYDIDDESARNPVARPFPFSPTLDPARFRDDYLASWETPVVVYRAVGKYSPDALTSWISSQDDRRTLSVFVGAASRDAATATTLGEAQAIRAASAPELALGGVAIPERHSRSGDEHLRLLRKQEAGSRFFVTQVVFDVNAAKNLVSDYFYECSARGIAPAPIVFTFSVCGSMKTLEFLRWLGVDVPRWIENDLRHAADTLDASYQQALANALDLIGYCRALGVPFGVNVESVSIRQVEIEAAVALARQLRSEVG